MIGCSIKKREMFSGKCFFGLALIDLRTTGPSYFRRQGIIKRYNNMEHVKLDLQFGLCVISV